MDAIRDEIDAMKLSETEKHVALTSLLIGLDKVDSTLGHFTSYLKTWSPRSYHPLLFKVPDLFLHEQSHTVIKGDIFDVIEGIKTDFMYFDPPYGSNNEKMPPSRVRYASYYHIWTSIIKNADAHYIALSYSSGGRATSEQLNDVLSQHGKLIKTIKLDHKKNVMASMRWTNEWLRDVQEPNREFIFLIEK